jgi:surface antigen
LAVVVVLTCGGCSTSSQLGSIFARGTSNSASPADLDSTGSVRAHKMVAAPAAGLPPERDLAYAKLAVAEVLARGGNDLSTPWENPRTGARGTVTPVASAYTQNGATCRDFLASYVREGSEAWMKGEACRMSQGDWQVKALRPWRRS